MTSKAAEGCLCVSRSSLSHLPSQISLKSNQLKSLNDPTTAESLSNYHQDQRVNISFKIKPFHCRFTVKNQMVVLHASSVSCLVWEATQLEWNDSVGGSEALKVILLCISSIVGQGWTLLRFVQPDSTGQNCAKIRGWCWGLQCMRGWCLRLGKVFRRMLLIFKFLAFDFCLLSELQDLHFSSFHIIPQNWEKMEKPAVLEESLSLKSQRAVLRVQDQV